MSVRTLTRRFQAETGQSPLQWLLYQRVDRARELLEVCKACPPKPATVQPEPTWNRLLKCHCSCSGSGPLPFRGPDPDRDKDRCYDAPWRPWLRRRRKSRPPTAAVTPAAAVKPTISPEPVAARWPSAAVELEAEADGEADAEAGGAADVCDPGTEAVPEDEAAGPGVALVSAL